MKERIESAGGSLQAGPQLGGGFEVMATLPYGSKEQATDETGEQYASEQSESCNTTAISSKAKLSDETIAPHTIVNISARIPDQPSEQTQETNQPTGRDPVSYTHLDVYKRQIKHTLCCCSSQSLQNNVMTKA